MDFDYLWTRYMGRDVTPAEYTADGWSAGGIMADLRELWAQHPTDPMTGDEIDSVTNLLAAGLEERGYPMRPAVDVETITLTTAHAASSYGRPVLILEGEAYGPADMTPAGMSAAELAAAWVTRFLAPLPAEARRLFLAEATE